VRQVRFVTRLPEVNDTIKKELISRLFAATLVWRGAVVRKMQGPKSGKFYRVPTTGVMYQASAPGESPAIREGLLRVSYGTDVDKEELIGFMGTDLDYGLYLERGTVHMEPRPVIEPAFMDVKDQITDLMKGPIRGN
jgi:hypothetical protein